MDAFHAAHGDGKTIVRCLVEAEDATKDEFAEVWIDSAKMDMARSYFLNRGADYILDGRNNNARANACVARFFEEYIAVEFHKTQALFHVPKIEEIYQADLHTLVKFLRRRIPCSCLDEKYEEVKSITKIGVCHNPQCSFPNRMVERSKTMYCSRCRCATYCSRECQRADWSRHKEYCDINSARKTEFDANKESQNT